MKAKICGFPVTDGAIGASGVPDKRTLRFTSDRISSIAPGMMRPTPILTDSLVGDLFISVFNFSTSLWSSLILSVRDSVVSLVFSPSVPGGLAIVSR